MDQRLYTRRASAGFYIDFWLIFSTWAGVFLFRVFVLTPILRTGRFPGVTQRMHALDADAGFQSESPPLRRWDSCFSSRKLQNA